MFLRWSICSIFYNVFIIDYGCVKMRFCGIKGSINAEYINVKNKITQNSKKKKENN